MGEKLSRGEYLLSSEQFEQILPEICDEQTSMDPEGWRPDNPLWGHCAVVSLVAQRLFGGTLMRASLEDTTYAESRSHYINEFDNSNRYDYTAGQFVHGYPEDLQYEERTREYLLSSSETSRRYELLEARLNHIVTNQT